MKTPPILLRKRKAEASDKKLRVTKKEVVEAISDKRFAGVRKCIILVNSIPASNRLRTNLINHQAINVEEQNREESPIEEKYQMDDSSDLQCDSCEETFEDRSCLIMHKTEKSIVRTRAVLRESVVTYKCDTCKHLFTSKGLLNRHFKYCGVSPASAGTRRTRKRRSLAKNDENHTEGPVQCPKCDKFFKRLKYLRVHMTTVHQERVTCQLCESDFSSAALLKTHMSEVHNDVAEFCPVCNKRFYSRQSLKVHIAAHNRDEKLSACEICKKTFRHEVYLRKHVQLVHIERGDRKKYRCDVCGYETQHKTCFRDHMFKHTGEDQVECDICGKSMRKNYMKMHLRIHTGEKPEICEYCGKGFSARKYLNKHRITHTGEKPHQCQICGKRYTQRSTLTLHFRRHHPAETSIPKMRRANEVETLSNEQHVIETDEAVEEVEESLVIEDENPVKCDDEMEEFEVLEETLELEEENVIDETPVT